MFGCLFHRWGGRKQKTEKKINKPRTFNYNCAVTNAIAQLSHLSPRVVLVCRLKFQVRFHSFAARLPLAFSMTSSSNRSDSTSHTWGRRRSAAMKECNVLFRLIQPWLRMYTIWCLRRANRRLIKQSTQIRTVRWSLAKKLYFDVRYFGIAKKNWPWPRRHINKTTTLGISWPARCRWKLIFSCNYICCSCLLAFVSAARRWKCWFYEHEDQRPSEKRELWKREIFIIFRWHLAPSSSLKSWLSLYLQRKQYKLFLSRVVKT